MNTRLLTALFVASTVLAPLAVRAADSDADRSHPVAFVKDSIITTKVKSRLAAEKLRTLAHVRVDTDRDGMVVLSGSARTQGSVDRAETIARNTKGVTSVQNNITVKSDD